MKTLLKLQFLVLISALVFTSCSDDDGGTNPIDNTKNYFALDSVSSITYDSKGLNPDNSTVPDSEYEFTYRNMGSETVTIDGTSKEAYKIETVRDNEVTNTNYYYEENGALYTNLAYLLPDEESMGEFGFVLGLISEAWVKMADQNGTSETLFTLDIPKTNVDLDLTGILSSKIGGKYTLIGEKGTLKTIKANDGNDYECQEFIIKHKFDAVVDAETSLGPINDQQIPFTLTARYYYAENIGLVKTVMEAQEINFIVASYPIPGFEDIMKAYTKK